MNNEQATDIVIDDGRKTYNIKNQEGVILGSFSLNPTDVRIKERYKEVSEFLDNIENYIDKTWDEDTIENELEKILADKIDYLFDSKCSQEFFKITSPWSVMANGDFFVSNVIEAIGKVLKVDITARNKRLESKIQKYTKKYHG